LAGFFIPLISQDSNTKRATKSKLSLRFFHSHSIDSPKNEMKKHLLLNLVLIGFYCFSCQEKEEQTNTISKTLKAYSLIDHGYVYHFDRPPTDTNFLCTGSYLYWQSNRDSSWLTLNSIRSGETLINSPYMGMWPPIGTYFLKENDSYLLFIHEWIS
jgi:hypothetical protein